MSVIAAAHDTIVALSSGQVPAGIAVVRVSGQRTSALLQEIAGSLPAPRRAEYRTFRASDGSWIDSGLILFFPSPASFTGEDCGEFHVHGGRAVVTAMLAELTSRDGVRLADAGEFTRRALHNGKMSLTGAEATADLISAETEAQRRFAIANFSGAHAALYAEWRRRIIHARAMIEAEIDFSDEEDVPGSVSASIWEDIRRLRDEIAAHADGYRKAEIVRDGFDVVLIGSPNAGKSSLLNAFARRDVAIVTAEPGTTRDLIEIVLDLEGLKVRVTDTAGLRETTSSVEQIGIERALQRAKQADLVLLLDDLSSSSQHHLSSLEPLGAVRVGTKADIAETTRDRHEADHAISVITGEGLEDLLKDIAARASLSAPGVGDVLPWRLRHVELLRGAIRHLDAAPAHVSGGLEIRAEELRLASEDLGRIVGEIDTEDLLDAIFSTFCIGK